MKLNELGEDGVISRLTRSLRVDGRVKVSAGDDCAIVETDGRPQLLKTDCIIEGIHFLSDANPRWIGWKAICRPISDIAAMGGTPLDALITLAIRPEAEFGWLKRIYGGANAAARAYGLNLVGGETAKSPGPLFISVAMTGHAADSTFVLRSGGKAGDWLYVTGTLGGSIRHKHLRFRPRVAEAQWLVNRFSIHAMMDLSDGLASDLPRLARASKLGFDVDLSMLPLSRGVTVQNGLRDGEDYELLFAVAPGERIRLEAEWRAQFGRLPLTAIGRLVEKGRTRFADKGYDHFTRG
ncbi:MAG: thiamine-phosphate kinase [Verrucomicrobia bacterium]|nr:thiamine-phosphate kinase [Verrucomicrobiota bacterium]